jgi:hypothetical protein
VVVHLTLHSKCIVDQRRGSNKSHDENESKGERKRDDITAASASSSSSSSGGSEMDGKGERPSAPPGGLLVNVSDDPDLPVLRPVMVISDSLFSYYHHHVVDGGDHGLHHCLSIKSPFSSSFSLE